MSEQSHDIEETTSEGGVAYLEPIVEDLDSVDGPAVTAAGNSKTV